MKNITKALFLAVIGAGLIAPVQAEEVHMIMCGGEIREADQAVISAFEAKHHLHRDAADLAQDTIHMCLTCV